MFTYKNKNYKQSPISENSTHQLSPRPPIAIQKKGKQYKIQHIHKQIQPNKPKHKPSSKSQLQAYQQKHHNSPIWPNLQTEDKPISPFSFTTILQKNTKEQSFTLSNITTDHLTIDSTQKYDLENKKKGNFNKKQNVYNSYFTPNILSTSLDKKAALQEMCFSLNTLQQHKHDISYEKSTGRQSKKSPIRLINPNKLNNTPKLKQRKQLKQIQQNRTFKAVLDSNINKSLRENSNEKINLECSEKIQNCMLDSNPCHQTNNHNKNSASKSKSNLQSTGFISMSQPVDCNQALLSHRTTRMGKENISRNNMVKKTISQQSVNQFHEDQQQPNSQALQTKLKELKSKIAYFQLDYSGKLINLDAQQFPQQIRQHHNPELSSNFLQQQIHQLKCLKEQTLSDISCLLQTFSQLSSKIINKINESIQVLEDSCKSSINWIQIQNQLAKKDYIELAMCKNQLILQNIDFRSLSLGKQSLDKQSISDHNLSIHQFISTIQASIQEQSAFTESQKTTVNTNTSLSQIASLQFQVINTKLNQLKSKLIQNIPKNI